MEFKIIPLTEDKLEEAILCIEEEFEIDNNDLIHPRNFLPASLNPETEISKRIYASTQCEEVKYFIAIDEETNKIIGITGYYTNEFDSKEADWITWFTVKSSYRRKGIGKELIDYIKKLSIQRQKHFIRLYTEPEVEKDAQLFYKRIGFKIIEREPLVYIHDKNIIYREFRLK
jgi:GNAT superfamily N-acetyltransferase